MSKRPVQAWRIRALIAFYKFCWEHRLAFKVKDIGKELGISESYICRFQADNKLDKIPYTKFDKDESRVRYIVDENTGCWNWQLYLDENGYPKDRSKYAYKVIYERLYGAVPKGLELDHLCKNRKCVNPNHLELVTHLENIRRGKHCKLSLNDAIKVRNLFA